jgi:hypothetical protein
MQLPDQLIRTGIALEDRFFDLKGLSLYSSMGVSSLRHHIRENGLPHYAVRGEKGQASKILVKRSEFDKWMAHKWRDDINRIADEVLRELKTDRQSEGRTSQLAEIIDKKHKRRARVQLGRINAIKTNHNPGHAGTHHKL